MCSHPADARSATTAIARALRLLMALACALTLFAAGCAAHPGATSAATAQPPSCPAALLPTLPRDDYAWVYLRPAAIYNDPNLGVVLAHVWDDASERALIERARRFGYDVRTLERAVVAFTPRGEVYTAHGPFDAARVGALFWDRLLAPRRRARDPRGNERIEGALPTGLAAVMLSPACQTLSYAEGDAADGVDRVLAGNDGRDPEDLLIWRTRRVPDAVRAAGDEALDHGLRRMEVRANSRPDGLRVSLRIDGEMPADAADRVRAALTRLVESPLGDLSGAVQWLTPEQVRLQVAGETLTLQVTVPWRALLALADGLRGRVGAPTAP